MCVLHMSSSPSYIVKLGRFRACIFNNHQEPSLHGGIQPPEKTGPKRSWGRCRRTLGSFAGQRLTLVSFQLGLGFILGGILPSLDVWMGLCLSPWCRICITLSRLRILVCFPLVFEYESCKICFLEYKWNQVNSKGICIKSIFIFPIWTIIGGQKRSLVIANKSPQLNLGSSQANS